MGPECGISVCDIAVVVFLLIGVIVATCAIVTNQSRGDLLCNSVHSDGTVGTCTKNTKTTALFPRKSFQVVLDERCAHGSLENGFAYGSCS